MLPTTPSLDTIAAARPGVAWPLQRLLAAVALGVALLLVACALFGSFAGAAGAAEIAAPTGQVVQYSYRDGDQLVFFDPTTYEQVLVSDVQAGAAGQDLVEGTEVVLVRRADGTLVVVQLPTTVR